MSIIVIATDWTPVVVALAASIPTLFAAMAAFLQGRSNAGNIQQVKDQTDGHLNRLNTQVASLQGDIALRDQADSDAKDAEIAQLKQPDPPPPGGPLGG